MKILVTGHLGFVGQHLWERLRHSHRPHLIGIDYKQGLPSSDITRCELPDDIDRVYHLAAQTNAQSTDAVGDAMTNIIGSIRVFEKYREKVVFASSSMVNYPTSPYALSKKTCEEYAKFYGCSVIRFCNLYGEGGHSVIDKFRESDTLTIKGDGKQIRTYQHVDYAVDRMLSLLPGEFQILYGQNLTVQQVAELFPEKPIKYVLSDGIDIQDGRQL